VPEGTRELRLVIIAPDYDAALRFYRDVLGLREEASFADDNGGRATLLHAGRATIELADDAHADAVDALEVGRRVAGSVRLAFEVHDAADTAERLVAAGARLVAPATRTPWGSLNARLDGPDGQHVTVYSPDVHVTHRPRLDGKVVLAAPEPTWATTAADLVRDIRVAIGTTARVLEHVGSTSVPGLPAKPVVDLVLGVPDAVDEAAYVPALEALGYQLRVREPEWHEHRLLTRTDPTVNLHVFVVGSDEIDRMVAFRDHLRSDAADRELYLRTKRTLAARTWAYTQDYADAKSDVVSDILRRALAREPGPLRGCFVVVSGPPSNGKARLAGDLARRLGLPLLATDTVTSALRDELGDVDAQGPDPFARAALTVLLALASQSGGAVLAAAWRPGRAADLSDLPGRVVEVSCRADQAAEPLAAGWPVLEQDVTGPVDVERLARRVRQLAGGA
jgi:GrpB-like predicted nucleotidyltransferase (UPF0157 family)/predicted enzyme related to lactoylglutathione lyase